MLNLAMGLLDQMFITWSTNLGVLLFGIAIATGVIALFCRLRTPRRWKE